MAKVEGPLYGEEATGSIHRLVNFTSQWGWHVVRKHLERKDRITVKRQRQRERFFAAKSAWNMLSNEEKMSWNARAPGTMNGYNAFIQAYMYGKTVEDYPLQQALYGGVVYGEAVYAQEK